MARRPTGGGRSAEVYQHEDQAVLRPEIGTQPQFRKRKPATRFSYDDSLSPALDWDGQNAAREQGEWLLAQIDEASHLPSPHLFPKPRTYGNIQIGGLADAVARLQAMSEPFLNWAGKAERLSFDVPTLPLFVHERLSTKAILETLTAHERDQQMELQLFGDPQLSLTQQLEAYEHTGDWVNRLILGDSLVVMNSLVEYEGLGGQVQMIYIDPPYGVKFGSNFQPFVRKRSVRDGADDDLTREPEMVKAYRDTWVLGIHSYLTYLRDRFLVARDLLSETGSLFIQIGDENVHHVREVLDDIFGADNFCSQVIFRKTTGKGSQRLDNTYDVILWYAKNRDRVKYRELYEQRTIADDQNLRWVELASGERRAMTTEEAAEAVALPPGARAFRYNPLTNQRPAQGADLRSYEYEGKTFTPGSGTFRTDEAGMDRLAAARRLLPSGKTLSFLRYLDDFSYKPRNDVWDDTRQSGFGESKTYVVQTATRVIERCILMTTDPGDLVLDPTCGSGTTAYIAEQWGRRWITIDTSRVPLALARQRLLTATFDYYSLRDPGRGPSAGFVYKRRQNAKGQEVGGIVPHITLKSIANNEPPQEEVLVDKPEVEPKVTRVTGPFCVEATIPTPLEADPDGQTEDSDDGSFADRLLDTLRRNPLLQLSANRSVTLTNVQPPATSLTLSAEANVDEEQVALVFGPENGSISERLVYEGAREAHLRGYGQIIFIGFAIEAGARELIQKSADLVSIPAFYVQATPDLVMGDLLKTMRSSQIFSVTGLPDVVVRKVPPDRYEVELRGLDVFDPITMDVDHRAGSDVPAWFLDTNYNEMVFLVSQAFFPRTSAWENLKKSLGGEYDDSVWEHLAGAASAPFLAGDRRMIAVKVIDDRGNELLVTKSLDEAR
jgi:adenine-specific DNA-methyltransferase